MCPECGSTHVTITEFDFGACRETGYRDAGEGFRCVFCNAAGPLDDLSAPSAEPFPRELHTADGTARYRRRDSPRVRRTNGRPRNSTNQFDAGPK